MFNKVSRVSRFGHSIPVICVLFGLVIGSIAMNQRASAQSAAVTSTPTPEPLAKLPTNSPLIGVWGRIAGKGESAFGEQLIFCADGTYAELRQKVEAAKDPEAILCGADRTAGTWNLSGNECTREHYRTPTERIREVSEIRIQGDQLIVTDRWTTITFHRLPDVPPATEKATGTAEAIESDWSYSKKLKKTLEGLGTPAPKPDDGTQK